MPHFLSSLRVRLFLLVLVALLPALGLVIHEEREERELVREITKHKVLGLAREVSDQHERIIDGAHQLLTGLSRLPAVRNHNSRACGAIFAEIFRQFEIYTNLTAVKPNGDTFCAAIPAKNPVNIADRPYFQEALRTRDLVVSEYLIGRITGLPTIAISHPSVGNGGRVEAVVLVGLNLNWLGKTLPGSKLPQGSALTVVDGNGTILARYPDSEKWIGKAMPDAPIIKLALANNSPGATEAVGLDGVLRLYGFTRMGSMNPGKYAYVSVGIPKETAFADFNRAFYQDLSLLGLAVLLSFAVAWVISDRSISRPVSKLVSATKRLAGGDLSARTALSHGSGEIGELAGAFDQMAESLEQNITERKQAQDQIQRNLDRIRALHEIDRAITSTLELRTILDILLENIDLALPYAATTIRLLNKDSGLLEPVACRNLDEEEWKAERWKGGRGIPNVVFETKAPVTISNVQTDSQNRDKEFFRKHRLVSYLGVPLIAKGEILGVISFYTKEEHKFDNEETEFLTTLAEQAAIAIHNSQVHEEMTKLVDDLAKSNRVKDEFLSVMSHELRTPLNVVVGYSGMLKDGLLGELNPKQQEALEKVINRANDQLTLVNNILFATVLEAEKLKIDIHEVNLGDFLNQLRSIYEAPINKEITLSWDYPAELTFVRTDSGKLKQILRNLIDNAIKFTEKGSVTVSAQIRQQAIGNRKEGSEATEDLTNASCLLPSASQVVEFKVADTGIGISKEHLPLIFEKFRQADSSETRPFSGVGIGLYIVKKLAESLGGKVDVESELGKGSTFTVTLPLEQ